MFRIWITAWIVIQALLLCRPCSTYADNFRLVEVAGNTGPLTYSSYHWAALNELGEACFRGADSAASAILRSNGTSRELVADSEDPSGLFERFTTGICSINDNGEVAFDACQDCSSDSPSYGVFKRTKSGILTIVQQTASGPSSFTQVALPTINSTGQVSFSGELNSGLRGIWIKSGGSLAGAFDSSGSFAELGGAFMNDSQQLTFGAKEDQAQFSGIYGPAGNRVMGTFNGFAQIGLPVINNAGNIAVMARREISPGDLNPLEGVYVNGALFLENRGEFGQVDLNDFQALSMNGQGDIVFPAIRPNGNSVVFLAAMGGVVKVIEKGDLLPGYTSPVLQANVGREALNNQRQVILVVTLQDGRQLVMRFDPDQLVFSNDQCPGDNLKLVPGICGCGITDADSNSDGILDCQVTPTARQLAQSLKSQVPKLKYLPSSASKKKKKALSLVKSGIKLELRSLVRLVNGSEPQVKLNSNRASARKLVKAVNTNVLKALKTDRSAIAQHKRLATKSLSSFLKALQ